MRLLCLLAVLALTVALLLLALHPLRFTHATWGHATSNSLTWWVINTPQCAGPLCINIFNDHASLEWHWAG